MEPTKIKKRNGTVVEFEKDKIRVAMEKAAAGIDLHINAKMFDVMSDHVVRHVQLKFRDTIPDVESVQDMVEQTLMEYGLFNVAKAYILYRAEHAKIREKKQPIEVEKQRLSYIDEAGKKHPLDKRRLTVIFSDAALGLKGVDSKSLVEHIEANLYDGISEQELKKALVLTARAFIEKDPVYSKLTMRLALQNLYDEVLGNIHKDSLFSSYRKTFIKNIKRMVEDGRLDKRILEFDLKELAEYIDPKRDDLFEYLGLQVLYDRYFLREEGGETKLETPQAFWMRVAMGLCFNEGVDKEKRAKEFYDIMSTLHYVPSTPTLFHSATTYPQLSSCYLNTVEDDLGHIFKVHGDNAQLSKYSGGIGTDWTNIRATGSLIKTTNVGSQGVIPFLKIANDVTVSINRSGKRRGATCVYLETWHLDIEDFLDLRRNTGDERRRTHDLNTANWIPDLFIKRVIKGEDWTLFSPEEVPELHHLYGKKFEKKYREYEKKTKTGEMKLFKTLPAQELWRKMISMLFETGHPWVTFKDPCNIRSPQDHIGVIHNSNLCTEITLNTSAEETAVCNLGSINLARHIKAGKLDEQKLKKTVSTAMRMLDNVIDLCFYPTKEARYANMRHRPVGLGIMGFQDALYQLDIDFDSETAVEFADQSMEMISYYAILASSHLAKERGAYETFPGSKWDRGILPIDTLDLLEEERGEPVPVSRKSRLDWAPVRESVKKYGMRNSNTMAIAPTATISNISGCYPCIEPIYKNLYVKSNMSGEFTVVNEYLVEDLKKLGLWNATMLDDLKRNDGNVQELTSIPPKLRSKYKDVFDVGSEQLIKIAAYRGKWIDQSQSLNIYFKGSSGKQLADVYLIGWHMGLKTTYYLRTVAASSIEKSTIDINKKVTNGNGVVSIPEPLYAQPAPVAIATASPPIPMINGVKACKIDDPDCEACQ